MAPQVIHDIIAGATKNDKGFLAAFLTLILPNIFEEPTREAIIKIHRLVRGIMDSDTLKF